MYKSYDHDDVNHIFVFSERREPNISKFINSSMRTAIVNIVIYDSTAWWLGLTG